MLKFPIVNDLSTAAKAPINIVSMIDLANINGSADRGGPGTLQQT